MAIKHKKVVSKQDKGLAEDWNDDHEITSDVDMVQNQLLNNVVENRTDFPAGPVEGQAVYRTDLNKFYIYNGATWDEYLKLESKTNYLSIPGSEFAPGIPATDDVIIDGDNGEFYLNSGTNKPAICGVKLPHGAVVTNVIVYGYTAWNWHLYRDTLQSSGFPLTMATAAVDTADSTIASPTIDNSLYKYWIQVYPLDADEAIESVKITYTIDNN